MSHNERLQEFLIDQLLRLSEEVELAVLRAHSRRVQLDVPVSTSHEIQMVAAQSLRNLVQDICKGEVVLR